MKVIGSPGPYSLKRLSMSSSVISAKGLSKAAPAWALRSAVVLVCALAMGFGTIFGGWKIIKTLGVKMLKLEPIHGFAAETSSAAIILVSSHFGLPVSTTHVVSTAILGVGATKRLSAVRWGIAGKIVMAWVLTLPFCIAMAWGVLRLIEK